MRYICRLVPLVLLCAAPVWAQTRPFLEVAPPVLGADGQITLSLPVGAALSSPRVRVGLFEAGREARVAEAKRELKLINGRWQTTVQMLEATPGHYEFRLLGNDRAATPLTADSASDSLLVPGIERGAGFWLFNGAPVAVFDDKNTATAELPLFLPALKRDFSRKAKAPQATWRAPGNATFAWRTLPLPTLRAMLAPNYDFAALRVETARRVQEAQNGGQRGFVGFALPAGSGAPLSANVANVLAQLRAILEAAAPSAALIFEVDATQSAAQAARDLDFVAAQCDAVLVRVGDAPESQWPVKVARKIAEEQPFFDLPVWVATSAAKDGLSAGIGDFFAGASGLILPPSAPGAEGAMPALDDFLRRNASLFTGSVTLEDAGLAFPFEGLGTVEDESPLVFFERLRSIGRVPLLARTSMPEKGASPDSFSLRLGERISTATVQNLEALVRAGARVYLEGAPQRDETGQVAPWRLETLVGATLAQLPAKNSALTLDDPWVFGTGRGTTVAVEQSVSVSLKPPTMASQAKTEKGAYTPTGSRAVAKLEDGSPAVIINTLGKGEVVWLPHRLKLTENVSAAIPTAPAPGSATAPAVPLTSEKLLPWQKLYAGLADYMAPRLVQLRAVEDSALGVAGPEAVRVALRRSPKGALLVALYNTAPRAAQISATVTGAARTALDLQTETEAPASIRGGQTTFTVTLAPRVWKIIALTTTRKVLDDERNAPRLKAKLR